MKKNLIALAGVFVILAIVLTGCFSDGAWRNCDIDTSSIKGDSGWTVTSKNIGGGYSQRDVDFSADNLTALHVESSIGDGAMELVLTQGSAKKTVEITGEMNQGIDMKDFKPGNIHMRLNAKEAKDGVSVIISW